MVSASVTNVCGNNTVQGTITAMTTGGNAPVTYAFLKTTNANTADNTLTYGAASTFQVTSATGGYGTYLVRAKDQCGVFTTVLKDVVATAPMAYYNLYNAQEIDCNTYTIFGSLLVGSTAFDPALAPGYTVEIFDVTGNLPSPCAVPGSATPVKSFTINSNNDLKVGFSKTIRQMVIRTTSPCGEVMVTCFDADANYNFIPLFNASPALSCATDGSGANRVSIRLQAYRYTYPLQVTIKNHQTGAVVTTDTWPSGSNIRQYEEDFLAQGYDITIVDACGKTATTTVVPEGPGTAVTTDVNTVLSCASVIGAKRPLVVLHGGLGTLDAGTTYQLVSGPSGPYSPTIQGSVAEDQSIFWNNLTPGTYVGQIVTTTSGCGPTSFTFTVPPNSPSSPGLIFDLSGSVSILCGGTGTITSVLNYNGYENISYDLVNASSMVLSTNSNGSFANLPAGTYTVKAHGTTGCGDPLQATKSYTITPAGAPPQITKKLGINCEQGNTAEGQALFEFNGVAPFLLEMKLTSSPTWITKASNLTATTFTVTNLDANATYDVRLTDNCGNSTVTTVSLKPLEAQSVTNTVQPCDNQPYTLSAPDFPNATYSWEKNGSVISTSKDIPFASFQPSDNGTYVCTITIGGCVVRTVTATLNSTNCGGPLPVNLVSFTAKVKDNSAVELAWITASERNNSHFLLERSKDLLSFEMVARVNAKEGESFKGYSYAYTDQSPYQGTSYYRLRQVDLDGSVHAFKAESVIINGHYGVYPNPVSGHVFSVNLDEPGTAVLHLYNADGREIGISQSASGSGRATVSTVSKLSSGVYVLTVSERGAQRTYRIVVSQ